MPKIQQPQSPAANLIDNSRFAPRSADSQRWLELVADVIDCDPPSPASSRRSRRDKWPDRLEIARSRNGTWVMVNEPLRCSTAAQLASDIRRSHARDTSKMRVRGLRPGERWEATHGPHPHSPADGEFFVWLRWLGPGNLTGL
jgi:hypothetical protein